MPFDVFDVPPEEKATGALDRSGPVAETAVTETTAVPQADGHSGGPGLEWIDPFETIQDS